MKFISYNNLSKELITKKKHAGLKNLCLLPLFLTALMPNGAGYCASMDADLMPTIPVPGSHGNVWTGLVYKIVDSHSTAEDPGLALTSWRSSNIHNAPAQTAEPHHNRLVQNRLTRPSESDRDDSEGWYFAPSSSGTSCYFRVSGIIAAQEQGLGVAYSYTPDPITKNMVRDSIAGLAVKSTSDPLLRVLSSSVFAIMGDRRFDLGFGEDQLETRRRRLATPSDDVSDKNRMVYYKISPESTDGPQQLSTWSLEMTVAQESAIFFKIKAHLGGRIHGQGLSQSCWSSRDLNRGFQPIRDREDRLVYYSNTDEPTTWQFILKNCDFFCKVHEFEYQVNRFNNAAQSNIDLREYDNREGASSLETTVSYENVIGTTSSINFSANSSITACLSRGMSVSAGYTPPAMSGGPSASLNSHQEQRIERTCLQQHGTSKTLSSQTTRSESFRMCVMPGQYKKVEIISTDQGGDLEFNATVEIHALCDRMRIDGTIARRTTLDPTIVLNILKRQDPGAFNDFTVDNGRRVVRGRTAGALMARIVEVKATIKDQQNNVIRDLQSNPVNGGEVI